MRLNPDLELDSGLIRGAVLVNNTIVEGVRKAQPQATHPVPQPYETVIQLQ